MTLKEVIEKIEEQIEEAQVEGRKSKVATLEEVLLLLECVETLE